MRPERHSIGAVIFDLWFEERAMGEKKRPSATPERRGTPPRSEPLPAAGPHAKPELTNEDATPGTGSLPRPGGGDEADSTTG